jgi:hypothetical protein
MSSQAVPEPSVLARAWIGWLRPLAGCLAAGLIVGLVVAGLGSRLVMRLLAVADSEARGTFTENGNRVGEITLGGTLGLVLFVGIFSGVTAGLVAFAVRRWLPVRAPGRGLVLSLVLLGLLGGTVIDAENLDFRILEPAGLAVALFGVLFLVAGLALAPLADRLGPGVPPALYGRNVTVVGATAIVVVTGFGLLGLAGDIAEIV